MHQHSETGEGGAMAGGGVDVVKARRAWVAMMNEHQNAKLKVPPRALAGARISHMTGLLSDLRLAPSLAFSTPQLLILERRENPARLRIATISTTAFSTRSHRADAF